MKCTNCGSEGPPGLLQCGKCGHRFPAPGTLASSLEPTSYRPNRDPAPDSGDLDLSLDNHRPSTETLDEERVAEEADLGASPLDAPLRRGGAGLPADKLASLENSDVWREKLSERVETFRRRRARLRDFDPNRSLDFEFQSDAGGSSDLGLGDLPSGEQPEVPAELEGESGGEIDEEPDAHESADEPILLGSTAGQAQGEGQGWSLGRGEPRGWRSLDVILGDAPWSTEVAEPESIFRPAPLGRRFIAALIDALVLLLGGGIFLLIFWGVGGRVDRSPTTLGVTAFIAVLLILVYFGSFTALTFSTPGLLSMGLEVRTLDGTPPTATDAALRAFGIVVSMSALMLGFIWAAVDSDSLTWHDRMSGTFIRERASGIEAGG